MWLSQSGACKYLDKSLAWLKQKQATGVFCEGIHYFKRGNSIFYSPSRLDEWVLGLDESNNHGKHLFNKQQTLSEYTSKWQADS